MPDPKSYWQILDEDICKYIDDELGEDSEYEALKLAIKTKPVVMRDEQQWEQWADSGKTPAAVIQGRHAEYRQDQHGWSQGMILASAYPYTVVAIVAGDEDYCRESSKTLIERLLTAFCAKTGFGVTVGSFTKTYFINITDALVFVWPKHDGQLRQFYGVAMVHIRLHDGNDNAR